MADNFLLEIGMEEIPARFINHTLSQIKKAADVLAENRLKYKNLSAYATPRRIVMFVESLSDKQEDLVTEVRGPAKNIAFDADGNPTKAAEGFAKSQGASVDKLEVRAVKNIEYVYAVIKEAGRDTYEILPDVVEHLIMNINFPKSMRWGKGDFKFIRPIRWILALFGDKKVPVKLADLESDSYTHGHRFLRNARIELKSADDYFQAMQDSYVIVDVEIRKRIIRNQIEKLAKTANAVVVNDDGLVDEVANLVEYPTAFIGAFDESYLDMPHDVIKTLMKEHQRYFHLLDKKTKNLIAKFIGVRNGTDDHLDVVVEGNERVLSARLADAKFFYQEDLKTSLVDKLHELKKITWLEGMGTIYEKAERIEKISEFLAQRLNLNTDRTGTILRAAKLCKADLVTNMVYEFPELQGVMGREYALKSGEKQEVAEAIYQHYLPRFAEDDIPSSIEGQCLGLADKLDTLTGCFIAGIKPTGSQDPYGLRRQASGIVRIILDIKTDISLSDMFEFTISNYKNYSDLKDIKLELEKFMAQRIRNALLDKGFEHDVIDAVMDVQSDCINVIFDRAHVLTKFKQKPDFVDLINAFNRSNNIAKKLEKEAVINEALLLEDEERGLYRSYIDTKKAITTALEHKRYEEAVEAMYGFCEPMNNFFDSVMVMVDDEKLRINRLALLAGIADEMKRIANFGKIVV